MNQILFKKGAEKAPKIGFGQKNRRILLSDAARRMDFAALARLARI